MNQAFLAALPMQYIPLLSETCHGGSDIPPAKISTVMPSPISSGPTSPHIPHAAQRRRQPPNSLVIAFVTAFSFEFGAIKRHCTSLATYILSRRLR